MNNRKQTTHESSRKFRGTLVVYDHDEWSKLRSLLSLVRKRAPAPLTQKALGAVDSGEAFFLRGEPILKSQYSKEFGDFDSNRWRYAGTGWFSINQAFWVIY